MGAGRVCAQLPGADRAQESLSALPVLAAPLLWTQSYFLLQTLERVELHLLSSGNVVTAQTWSLSEYLNPNAWPREQLHIGNAGGGYQNKQIPIIALVIIKETVMERL